MLIGWKAAGNDRRVASLRYRVENPVRALQALGHSVEIFDPARETDYDVVIFAKTYSLGDRALAGRVRARGGRVVFDLCDNHFYNPNDLPKYRQVREELLDMLSLAQHLVCTTPALAKVVREEAPWAAEPQVIGDAVERAAPVAPLLPAAPDRTRLLWFGSQGAPNAPAGMSDLLRIKDELVEAAAKGSVELVVCSNSREKFEQLIEPLPLATRYIEWSLEGFPAVLASADAVLIPISPNPFTACKTNNRLVMALNAGVPVIADSIESYLEFAPFCTLDDWSGGLARIIADPEGERARAAAARSYIDRCWTSEALALKWEEVLGLAAKAEKPAAPAVSDRPRSLEIASDVALQGALDPASRGVVTGWVRVPTSPQTRLEVRLVSGGRTLARCRADRPRPDLAAAGFVEPGCGFVLEAATNEQDGRLEVIVAGADWRFPGQAHPARAASSPRGGEAHPSASSMAEATTLRPSPSRQSAAEAMAVQQELLDELQSLTTLMDSAREAAARMVIAAGDDAATGRKVLRLFTRELRPELDKVVSWAQPNASLN